MPQQMQLLLLGLNPALMEVVHTTENHQVLMFAQLWAIAHFILSFLTIAADSNQAVILVKLLCHEIRLEIEKFTFSSPPTNRFIPNLRKNFE